MAIITVRGRVIKVQAKAGTQREFVRSMYEKYSDERLDELEQESWEHGNIQRANANQTRR